MSDDDKIIRLLQDDGAPPLGTDAAQRIAARAVAEFKRTQPAARAGFSIRKPVFAGFALAAMVLLGVFVWQGGRTVTRADRERVLLAEFNEMFGGRLQAVVTVNGKTQLILGEAEVARGQPVVIHLSEKGQKVDIVSFSGESVAVSIGGRAVNFDTLVDGKGKVILAGEDFVWRDGKSEGERGLKIEAKALEM